ncbi:hypothetical protein ACFU7Y_12940 [Kitasatospora sp. NPDC057542]|uniref:hypothetical protein n=1 Tax=Streptomycetaceae TaxID=2062 RepID=UPI001CCABD8C|nr:hypothetical protein [Streptomyces sp. LS1784]
MPAPHPVFLAPYVQGSSTQQFGTISAGRSGTDSCFHLVQNGQYVNSTSAHPRDPQNGSSVTLGGFRPNDDGYLWCTTSDGSGTLLTNHTDTSAHLDLTKSPISDVAVPSGPDSGIPRLHWHLRAASQ